MSSTGQQAINININQIIVAFVASMVISAAFVAFITNAIINGKVNALDDQANPASATAAAQTNNAPDDLCVGVATPQNGDTAGAAGVGNTNGLKFLAGGGSFSYTLNQSNSSTTTNNTTNTAIDNRVDNRYSGNSLSFSLRMNNGNTTNSGNTSDSGNTAVSAVDNSNNSVNNSGNTANTVNDNSDSSIHDNLNGNAVVVTP